MFRFLRQTLLALAFTGALHSASGFSLLGPFDTWQVPGLAYNPRNFDIGGPMNIGEEYRWNIRTITYGFDESFLNYFGQRGVEEINKAVAIINKLPPVSKMSSNLVEFPMDATRANSRASALGLADLKSTAMGLLLEEMGLASPERYVWALRDRRTFSSPNSTNYLVIKRNFDPVTFAPSSYVNGTLYTYSIGEFAVLGGGQYADAVEAPVDPLAFTDTAVVSSADNTESAGGLLNGDYYTGLTRDDVGGLRYLYRKNNFNVEGLIPGTTGGGGSPFAPVGSFIPVDVALRPGVEKITFKRARYDSQVGDFITTVRSYRDTYVVNSTLFKQGTQRVLTQPDILFTAEDLGLNNGGEPIGTVRTTCAAPVWVNNDPLNGQVTLAGPGQIQPQVIIRFNKIGPFNINVNPRFLDEANHLRFGFVWGSFDGTTNEPVVYPIGTSVGELEQRILSGH